MKTIDQEFNELRQAGESIGAEYPKALAVSEEIWHYALNVLPPIVPAGSTLSKTDMWGMGEPYAHRTDGEPVYYWFKSQKANGHYWAVLGTQSEAREAFKAIDIRSAEGVAQLAYRKEHYDYKGYGGCSSFCGVEIYETVEGQHLVVLTEQPSNPGTSTTNAFEIIATQIVGDGRVKVGRVRWFDHYPGDRNSRDIIKKPSWTEAFLTWDVRAGVYRGATWKHLTEEEFIAIVGSRSVGYAV